MPSERAVVSPRPQLSWSLMLAALRYRNFRLVWAGSFTEHLGEFMEIAGTLWLVNELTHSPLWLSIVGSSRFIPMIFFPPVGGVVADRVNRRALLIAALLGQAALSAALLGLAVTDNITLSSLIVISLLSGIATSFNHPARQTIVPNLVNREHLLNAVSLDLLSVQLSRAIGTLIGGYIIALLGVSPVFAIRAGGCLLAIFWLLLARVPATPPGSKQSAPWHNFAEGFRYVRGHALILILVLLCALPYLAQNTYMNFVPVVARDILQVGAVGYGYLQGAPGLGALIFLVSLGLLTYYPNKFRLLVVTGVLMGLAILGLAASSSFPLSLTLLVIIGGMLASFSAIDATLLQGAVPDEIRGRILSQREVLFGLGPTGSIIFGAIAQSRGVPLSLALLGLIAVTVSLLLILLLPRFRGMG